MPIPSNILTGNDFIGVRAKLVELVGNDGNRALVLTRIHFRADERWREAHEGDGQWWWRATLQTIADETGLNWQQVRRCIVWLLENDFIRAREFRQGGITDRTLSYRVITELSETKDEYSESKTQSLPESNTQSLSESKTLPSMQKMKTLKTLDGDRTTEEVDAAFGHFWQAYPRHIAKAKARAAFEKALTKARAAVLVEAARQYRISVGDSDPKFIAHPTSWLNGERWDDDLGPVAGTGRDSIRSL